MAQPHKIKQERVPLDQLQEKFESQEIKLYSTINRGKTTSWNTQIRHNEYQNFLYNRALFGLSIYSKEELLEMHWDKKKRIVKVHKRAQTLLNIWKQEIVNMLSNHFFKTIFPDSPLTKELLEKYGNITDELYINKMSLKNLYIRKADIIHRFIVEGILPKNFNELKQEKDASRISSKRKLDTSVKSGKCSGRRVIKISD